KFSLRGMVAAALLELDTAAPALYSEQTAQLPELVSLRDRVEVLFDEARGGSTTEVVVHLKSGAVLSELFDTAVQIGSTTLRPRIFEKLLSLAEPVLGEAAARRLMGMLQQLESLAYIGEAVRLSARAG